MSKQSHDFLAAPVVKVSSMIISWSFLANHRMVYCLKGNALQPWCKEVNPSHLLAWGNGDGQFMLWNKFKDIFMKMTKHIDIHCKCNDPPKTEDHFNNYQNNDCSAFSTSEASRFFIPFACTSDCSTVSIKGQQHTVNHQCLSFFLRMDTENHILETLQTPSFTGDLSNFVHNFPTCWPLKVSLNNDSSSGISPSRSTQVLLPRIDTFWRQLRMTRTFFYFVETSPVQSA